jgi:segregation and condensation protein A
VATLHNPELVEVPEKSSGFAVNLSNFEGPFDLLLTLISKHEMDITEISLSKVTDEFISYLKQLDDAEELEQASEFLVIAATLLDLKIVSLLPRGELVDAEDVALLEARDLLFARLLQYKAFKEVSGWFAIRIEMEATRVARDVPIETRFRESTPELVWTMTLEEFVQAAFEEAGLNWRDHVIQDPSLFRPTDLAIGRADPSKAAKELHWQASTRGVDVVKKMYQSI